MESARDLSLKTKRTVRKAIQAMTGPGRSEPMKNSPGMEVQT